MIFISILILIVAIALPSINKFISPIFLTRISTLVFIYAGALSFNAFYIQSIGSGLGIYSGLFHITAVSQLFDTFIFIIAAIILISWPSIQTVFGIGQANDSVIKAANQLNNNILGTNTASQYSIIVLFSTLGASLLVSSADLISMYLSIELQSFGVYILSTIYRDSESATSAGLKYFLLGCLSSCLILLGAGLIYAFTGLTNFESIYSLISVSESSQLTGYAGGLSLGLIIIIIGFLFKIAAAPLHNWSIDVYNDSPTIVTIWLTTMPKISILIFILELYTQISIVNTPFYLPSILNILISENTFNIFQNLLLISSLLSLIIGTVVGLAQSKIKRLLAYSTISHVGFILLALAINTEQSIDSLLFYIIQYSITNINTFLIILALGYLINNTKDYSTNSKSSTLFLQSGGLETVDNNYNYNSTEGRDIKFISELKGQFFANPLLSICLTICLFSMAGVPPLLGFFSKQFVLYSAIQSGYYFMAIVGIIVSVISASYYLKIIRVLHSSTYSNSGYIEENSTEQLNLGILSQTAPTNFHSFMISTLTLSILLFILKPSILLNSTQLLSLSLFYY